MSRNRKKAAVPVEELLADGSGPHRRPHQGLDSLAEAGRSMLGRALAEDPAKDASEDEVAPDDVLYEADPVARKKRGAAGRKKAEDREDAAAAGADAAAVTDSGGDGADDETVALEDSEVGPELEEAEVEAVQAAQSDERSLEEAVMRAEAEAELGTAEPEGEAGEEELELGAALPTTAASMDDVQLKHLVEALIFAADKPVTLLRLRQLTRVSDVKRLEAALATLAEDFADRGIALQRVSGGYQFRTNTQFSVWVQQLIAGRPVRLSRAQLETLAIIAYRQPITRPEVDDIRGVDSSATLRLLMDRGLIRILGKKEEVGRPLLYGTTKDFLDFFSLSDLRELPTLREYSELSAESRQVMSDRLGVDAEGRRLGEDGSIDVSAVDESAGESMEAAAPEPTVDDLVREFATTPLQVRGELGAERIGDDSADDDSEAAEDVTTGVAAEHASAPEPLDATDEPPTD